MQDEEPVGTPFIASSNPALDAKNDVPANADEHAAVPDAKKRVPTKLKFRNILARIVLVLLFAIGFFVSAIPAGRAPPRALYIFAVRVLCSQPGILSLAEQARPARPRT